MNPMNGYLFTDDSRGTYSRTQIILIPGAGRSSSVAWAAFSQIQSGPFPALVQATSVAREIYP
jgi:hypothetical protein